MTVISVHKDPAALTMTLTAEFDAPVDRCWQLWDDPRQLERWWGPPTYPATFGAHDLTPGATVTYFMTGPEGDTHHGWWKITAVDAPHGLALVDGFADSTGVPNPEMPTSEMSMNLDACDDGRTRMILRTTFPSIEAMEQVVAMGMEEGLTAAVGQIDGILQDT